MSSIQKKIATNYWRQKLQYNTSNDSYACSKQNNTSTKSFVVEDNNLEYFYKLTSGNYLAEFTLLLTVFNVLLQRYFEECDLIYSQGITSEDKTPLLFSFNDIENRILKKILQEVKQEIQEVYQHQDYDNSVLQEETFKRYTPFEFMFNKNIKSSSSFSLIIIKKQNQDLEFSVSFAKDFVTNELAENFLQKFIFWIQQLEVNIECHTSGIPILFDEEKKAFLSQQNVITNDETLDDHTIISLFEEQVLKTPDLIALEFKEKSLTYNELNEKSNSLSDYLQREKSIGKGDFVGVKLQRREYLLISLLAVLKTGATYVPIDINYPEERISYIESDSNCKFVIDEHELEIFLGLHNQYNKENTPLLSCSKDLAYIIYTSGTTGNPKGVMITHQNAVALIGWAKDEFKNTNFEVVYAATSHCFDLSVYEFFYTLSIGKKIKLLDNSLDIGKHLKDHNNILLNTVPSSIRNILESGYDLTNVSAINLAGEPFPVDIAQKLLMYEMEIRNLYGPSEDTTYSTHYKLSKDKKYRTSIPIGKPITGTKAYILDEHKQLLPYGAVGKLYVAGDGVAKGYLNRSDLTREKFSEDPFQKGQFMYDTGDMAKWMPDGNLEFLGRKDHQVKLRGYRIELGEIESAISRFSENIQQAVVSVKNVKNVDVLVGYYVEDSVINKSELRSFLQDQLPSYMIPGHLIVIESVPLTANGKVNKKLLPELDYVEIIKNDYVAPRNETEEKLVILWEEIIGVNNIGIKDNFFELGGHSLMIAQLINRVYKGMGKSVSYSFFYNNPTIEKLSSNLEERQFLSINKAAKQDFYPTTPSQQRIWFLSQFEDDNQAYHISGAVALEGEINIENFTRAFYYVINRHEVLWSYFKNNDEGILEHSIAEGSERNLNLLVKDFSKAKSPDLSIRKYIKEEEDKGFNLSVYPLFRSSLLKKNDTNFVFFLSIHHIISDGWSLEILTSEIIEAYAQLQSSGVLSLPELTLQFKDYTVWLSENKRQSIENQSKQYWLNVFKGEIPVIELPSAKKRPLIKTYKGSVVTHKFSRDTLNNLKHFSQKHEVTLFMTLMSAVKILICRYSNQNDVIVGTPVAGREHPDLESQVGLYLNTLAIRTQYEKEETFISALEKEKQNLIGAYSHQNYPFDLLVEELNLVRDTSRSPLFDIMVVLNNQKQLSAFDNKNTNSDFTINKYDLDTDSSQFDMSLSFVEDEDLFLNISFNTDIYDESFVKTIIIHLEKVLGNALIYPEAKLSEIEIITEEEKNLVLQGFNNTEVYYNQEETIVSLIENQVLKTPNDVAIIYKETILSYKELNERANQLADYLTKEKEIIEGDFIGVKLERNEQLVISLLAVLKIGATYVPIDINYPKERVDYIENDSRCVTVIDQEFLNFYDKDKKSYSKENPKFNFAADDLAYIIYTSGTTGNPKGVMLTHKNAVSFINWAKDEFANIDFDIVYASTSHCFDLSVFEFFFTLSSGKKIRLLDSALEIGEYLKQDDKVLINTVPSSMRNIIENEYDLNNVRAINLAGEPFPTDIARKLLMLEVEIRNLYGPSEDTTYSTCYKLSKNKIYSTIPIGKPIANSKAYILGDNGELLPPGVIGKLFLSGDGVAKGYLNRPELTSERFVKNPFSNEGFMYDTGDIAKWLPDGNIEFYGRNDNQVKLRGYRIELGEIENSILQFSEDIAQVVVTKKTKDNQDILIAYFLEKESVKIEKLQKYLQNKLPYYMIPDHYFAVESIPLTPNGKIDQNKLPGIESGKIYKKKYVAPENEFEKKLAIIWQEVLEIEKVGATDNFFELGGHSLKITKLMNRIYKTFNIKVTASTLFYNNILREQSAIIQSILDKEKQLENPKAEYVEVEKFSI